MYTSCQEKQEVVKSWFATCGDEEQRYNKIIEVGRHVPPMDAALKTPEHEVPGCQSVMYLTAELKEGKVYFALDSEALISKGLGALLLHVYSGEAPEVILKCPPDYLQELGIHASLTPGRANGLLSIHLKMKQEALRLMLAMGQKGC